MLVRPADRGVALEFADNFPKDLFALAISIGPRGIKKITAKFNGAAQRRHGLRVVGPRPASKPPHAVTNFADVPSRPPKPPVIHRYCLLGCEAIVAKAPVARESQVAPLSICPQALGMPQYSSMSKTTFIATSLAAAGLFLAASTPAQQTPAANSPSTPPAAAKPATAAKTAQTPAAKTGAAATAKTPVPLTLKTPSQKASYAIGMNIGKNLKRDSVEVDPAVLLRGLKDALAGNKLLLTDEEAKAALTALQAEVRAKEEAKTKAAAVENKKTGEAFLAANKTKQGVVTLPSGLQYKIIKEGTGPKPTADDTVLCHYRGALVDNTEFDSSYKRGEPLKIPVGGVIKGWTEAIQLMPVGSKWQLFIPSDLAYGDRGAPGSPIGPNSTLVFDVELISIEPKPAAKEQPKEQPKEAPKETPKVQPGEQPKTPPKEQAPAAPQPKP